MVRGKTQLEHSGHMVKVGVEATCKHFKPWHILKKTEPNELWLIGHLKIFVNGSRSIIRNNLGLCKHSEIYLIWNFQNHCHGSTGIKT